MTAPTSISLLAQLAAQQAANKGTAAAGTEKKPAPKLYVNVGIEHPTLGFVSLPFNLALDDMKHRDVKGSDEWKVRAEISNWLLDNLRGAITELPPGSEGAVMVDELKVQLFHRILLMLIVHKMPSLPLAHIGNMHAIIYNSDSILK